MKMSSISFGVLLSLLLLGCNDFGSQSDRPGVLPRPLTSAEQALVASDNSFGFKLFNAVNASETGKSVFISPVSISMALGMTLNGANGSTRDGMARTLEFAGLSQSDINVSYQSLISLLTGLDPKVTLQIANSIWHRPDLNVEQAFKDVNRIHFNAEVNSLNFADPSAARTINAWVDRNTNGKITSIVPDPIPGDMMMYLINAIYFKGTWLYRFDPNQTRDDSFTTPDGSTKPCKMMSQGDTLNYMSNDNLQAIDLPYGFAGFSMTILLPSAGTNIDAFAGALTQEQWNAWSGGFQKRRVDLFLPKFKLEYDKKLNDQLKAMGMAVAFSQYADFTNIDKRGGLCISEVKHKSFIQVDEEGTEAAAVTSVGVEKTVSNGGDTIALMRVDRPFVFLIRENHSGTILFIGKIVEPTP